MQFRRPTFGGQAQPNCRELTSCLALIWVRNLHTVPCRRTSSGW
jgi:hypothetical protein